MMRTASPGCGLYAACLLAIGCGGGKAGGPTGTGESQTATISSSAGGTITVDGTTLSVPPGALPADTAITMTSTTGSPPAGYSTWYSPLFKFEPDGLVFQVPVEVSLAFDGSASDPVVMWSQPTGGFENLGGTVSGGVITTHIVHFSAGFVAPAPVAGGPDAADGTPGDGGVAGPDGGAGTCNKNGVCDPGEDPTCPDCGPRGDGGVAGMDGGVAVPDGGSGTCNKNGVCDPGEDPACPDCGLHGDGGITGADGGSATCNHNGVCDPGEDPACPDCATSGTCNKNGVCDPGEDPACPDCATSTCNHNGVCDPGEDPACPDCAGGIKPGAGFHLLAAYSSGGAEAVSEVDPVTGSAAHVGGFSGLVGWGGQFRIAADDLHAYALGDDGSFSPRLWTLDLTTGTSTSTSVASGLFLGGVTDKGELLVASWNGSTEQVSRMNPQTGASTPVGVLGGLVGWQGQMAFDRASNKLYAIGQPSMMSTSSDLYQLDLATGTSSSVGVAHEYVLGGVRSDGSLIGSYWNGSSQRVVAINPTTGAETDLGALGLGGWWNSLTFDPQATRAYAFGTSDAMSTAVQLYWLDTSTGSAGSVSAGQQYSAGRY